MTIPFTPEAQIVSFSVVYDLLLNFEEKAWNDPIDIVKVKNDHMHIVHQPQSPNFSPILLYV